MVNDVFQIGLLHFVLARCHRKLHLTQSTVEI